MLLRSIRTQMLLLVIATIIPFTILIGIRLWNQWRSDYAQAMEIALVEARLLAVQVDDNIGNLDNLMTGLSRAVSWNPADATANDALLRKVKTELPPFIANILVFSLDGTDIGRSSGAGRSFVGDRAYFQQVLAGHRRSISEVLSTRIAGQWSVLFARPVEDDTGRLRAVLAVGTVLERFHESLGTARLPPGSVVQILDEHGTVIARSSQSSEWIGRDLSGQKQNAQHMAAREASQFTVWADGVERITGSSTAKKVPWLVSVGLPTDAAHATVLWRLRWGALYLTVTLLLTSAIAWT